MKVLIITMILIDDVLFLQRRFPDFTYINKNGSLTEFLDCVIIRSADVAAISILCWS